MAQYDPTQKSLIRMELRRFASRCQSNEGLLQRADSLREVARLATISVPYRISGEHDARDLQRRLQLVAEDRAKELILEQIAAIFKVDANSRSGIRNKVADDWAALTGPLAHLRHWATLKLAAAGQMQQESR